MKKILLSAVACVLLVSCGKSESEQITENYLLEKEYPDLVAGVALLNGEIKEFKIKNFTKNPVDTIFMWEKYRDWELADAQRSLEHNKEMQNLFGELDELLGNNEEAEQRKETIKSDSIKVAEATAQMEKYKETGEIFALGYGFDLVTRVKLAGNEKEQTKQRISYITTDKKVTKIVDK